MKRSKNHNPINCSIENKMIYNLNHIWWWWWWSKSLSDLFLLLLYLPFLRNYYHHHILSFIEWLLVNDCSFLLLLKIFTSLMVRHFYDFCFVRDQCLCFMCYFLLLFLFCIRHHSVLIEYLPGFIFATHK